MGTLIEKLEYARRYINLIRSYILKAKYGTNITKDMRALSYVSAVAKELKYLKPLSGFPAYPDKILKGYQAYLADGSIVTGTFVPSASQGTCKITIINNSSNVKIVKSVKNVNGKLQCSLCSNGERIDISMNIGQRTGFVYTNIISTTVIAGPYIVYSETNPNKTAGFIYGKYFVDSSGSKVEANKGFVVTLWQEYSGGTITII